MTSLFSDAPTEFSFSEVEGEPIGEERAPDDKAVPVDITDERVNWDVPDPKKPRNTKIKQGLEGIYTMAGTLTFQFDQQVGQVILQNASNCAESLDQLAKENPKVKKALENLLQTSAWGAVIAAHLPIAIIVATKYVPPVRDNYQAKIREAMQAQEAHQ